MKVICENGIRESLESNTLLSPSMKQLAIWLDDEVLNTLCKFLCELFDGLQMQRNDALHCKLQFTASAYCCGYLPPLLSNGKLESTIVLLETAHGISQRLVTSRQFSVPGEVEMNISIMAISGKTDKGCSDRFIPLWFGKENLPLESICHTHYCLTSPTTLRLYFSSFSTS